MKGVGEEGKKIKPCLDSFGLKVEKKYVEKVAYKIALTQGMKPY